MSIDNIYENNYENFDWLDKDHYLEKSRNLKIIKDNVHGYIELEPYCLRIIDTPEFQRLRQIHQLGVAYFVFPTANHSRFEHSLGVAHLAKKWLNILKQKHNQLDITEKEIELVTVAALVHDLGHCVFSHTWEHVLHDFKVDYVEHEEMSCRIFKYMNEKYGFGYSEADLKFIGDIISGNYEKDKNYPSPQAAFKEEDWIIGSTMESQENNGNYLNGPRSLRDNPQYKNTKRYFLYEIVANHVNGIDVDKLDYFARDVEAINIKVGFDSDRLFHNSKIIGGHICFYYKEYLTMCDLFDTRYRLHRTIYRHSVVESVTHMIVDFLKLLMPILNPHKAYRSNNEGIEHFITLTDTYVLTIGSMNPSSFKDLTDLQFKCLERAGKLLKRIYERKLYKMVCQHVLKTEVYQQYEKILKKEFNSNSIVEYFKMKIDSRNSPSPKITHEIATENMICDIIKRGYSGNVSFNPLDHILFYNSVNVHRAFLMNAENVTSMTSNNVVEIILTVYVRENIEELRNQVRIGFREFIMATFSDDIGIPPSEQISSPNSLRSPTSFMLSSMTNEILSSDEDDEVDIELHTQKHAQKIEKKNNRKMNSKNSKNPKSTTNNNNSSINNSKKYTLKKAPIIDNL
eukprot:TRINITY_DN5023_c0_g1_i1.p1 TRINITY_DN5023_c0_g1~~TRINITY_DN5023_c0_g1_i1.p1  ORF type:complete len:638 (+),score=119.31 TRINITY_DN5023_c0_g1_i1:32-1915(+)